jgi:hypothetical protein
VPLICARELDIDGGTPRCVRVMVHLYTERSRDELHHVYLEGAGPCATTCRTAWTPAAEIVGTGLIGGSIGLALRAQGWTSPAPTATRVARRALDLGAPRRRRRGSRGGHHVRGHARRLGARTWSRRRWPAPAGW